MYRYFSVAWLKFFFLSRLVKSYVLVLVLIQYMYVFTNLLCLEAKNAFMSDIIMTNFCWPSWQ